MVLSNSCTLTSWAAEDISHHFTVPFEDIAHAYFDWGYGRSSQKTHLTWKYVSQLFWVFFIEHFFIQVKFR